MHYDIEYNRASAVAWRKACIDTLDYIGPTKYRILVGALKGGTSPKMFTFMCGMVGVEGFPVDAILERYRIAKRFHYYLENKMVRAMCKQVPQFLVIDAMDVVDNFLLDMPQGTKMLWATALYKDQATMGFNPNDNSFILVQ